MPKGCHSTAGHDASGARHLLVRMPTPSSSSPEVRAIPQSHSLSDCGAQRPGKPLKSVDGDLHSAQPRSSIASTARPEGVAAAGRPGSFHRACVAATLHPDHDTIGTFRLANKTYVEMAFLRILLWRARPGCGSWARCPSTAPILTPTPHSDRSHPATALTMSYQRPSPRHGAGSTDHGESG
jgi:hypothetical protein